MSAFHLEIITPTALKYVEKVEYLRAPGLDGYFGVMKKHSPALISIDTGAVKITKSGKESFWATSGGYADIQKDKVQLLLETAERTDQINLERAQKSVERAQLRLQDQNTDHARAKGSLFRAMNRMRIGNL